MSRGTATIPTLPLGQVGFRFDLGGTVLYVDPYLSDSVRQHEAEDLARLLPVPVPPEGVTDADLVLITHEHRDHCDCDTLVPLATASPQCRMAGPPPVIDQLRRAGIAEGRLVEMRAGALQLAPDLSVLPVPAMHPRIEPLAGGGWRSIGYLIEWRGRRLWHAGDTGVCDELIEHLRRLGPIDVALLPVNESNHFRRRRGIVGNMSVREAFQLAEELGVRCVVPTHWDMFRANCTFEEEIRLLYGLLKPPFRLAINPTRLDLG